LHDRDPSLPAKNRFYESTQRLIQPRRVLWQQATDGAKAMREYNDQIEATRKKTERLKALRLAREAEPATVAPATKPAPKAKPRAAKAPTA
jgi:hypothetical protein